MIKGCGKCCQKVVLPYPNIPNKDMERWLKFHKIEIKNGSIIIYNKCDKLTDDGLCSIYEDRPQLCRDYDCTRKKECCLDG